MEPLIVKPHALYELIVKPHFTDILPDFNGNYTGALNEFTVMDEVSLAKGTPIMEIVSTGNFLKRKDISCKTDWSKVANTAARKITIDELYGAVMNCQEEFYQGCLKDFRDHNPKFRDLILKFFKNGVGMDIAVNSYFGDITRPAEATGTWNWNSFDGIITKYAKYIADGTIPAGQVLNALADGEVTPAVAFSYFQDAYDKQSALMDALPDSMKAFYVSKKLAKGLWRYYKSLGIEAENTISVYQQGLPALKFEGIPVYVEPLWDTVLKVLNGAGGAAHLLILTIRGNWIFGTNKTYGGGANMNQALRVWWNEDDEVWKYKMHLTAGTELGLPEHTVFGMTNIA